MTSSTGESQIKRVADQAIALGADFVEVVDAKNGHSGGIWATWGHGTPGALEFREYARAHGFKSDLASIKGTRILAWVENF